MNVKMSASVVAPFLNLWASVRDQSVLGSSEPWRMERAQHAAYNPIFETIIQTSLVVVLKKIKWPAQKVEGDHQLRRPHFYPYSLISIYDLLNVKEYWA